MAKWEKSMFSMFIVVLSLSFVALGNEITNADFQAFYFFQQWLGSYCNQKGTPCCYPPTGKPSPDFTVAGLWPYDGNFPTNCAGSSLDVAPLKPLQDSLQAAWPSFTCPQIGRKFWLHEWNKRGTCSKTILDEISYLKAAVNLKNKVNLFQALGKAGIRPNNQFYNLDSIKQAVSSAFGFEPWVACNHNAQGNSQLWQITLCVEKTGNNLIKCPNIPPGNCPASIQFPSY
ncbi:ribonuclease 1-like [Silene latifolia]|uniref:ribonuclease 1-like n=1 Tax=Silene latifolia TaxID=37657 RepID=UPI003D76D8AC